MPCMWLARREEAAVEQAALVLVLATRPSLGPACSRPTVARAVRKVSFLSLIYWKRSGAG
jgi:hypothetical protein